MEIDSTSKLLTVVWQDGSEQENISSTEVLPVLHVDDLEFFPGDFVVDKSKKFYGSQIIQCSISPHDFREIVLPWSYKYIH